MTGKKFFVAYITAVETMAILIALLRS